MTSTSQDGVRRSLGQTFVSYMPKRSFMDKENPEPMAIEMSIQMENLETWQLTHNNPVN